MTPAFRANIPDSHKPIGDAISRLLYVLGITILPNELSELVEAYHRDEGTVGSSD